jgi:hypothetical protein
MRKEATMSESKNVHVAVNGYGVIGKRVAAAVPPNLTCCSKACRTS